MTETGRAKGVDSATARQIDVWQWYYKKSTAPPLDRNSYTELTGRITTAVPEFLDKSDPKTFLLAGFHAFNGTPRAFIRFAKEVHPNRNDMHIFLDMNSQGMKKVPDRASAHKVIARLEELSFRDSTLDLILVDFTTDFMSDKQVRAFAERASHQLSKQGVLLVAKKFLEVAEYFPSKYPTLYFPRSLRKFLRLMEILKPIAFTADEWTDFATYIAFARQDSSFEPKVPDKRLLAEETKESPGLK